MWANYYSDSKSAALKVRISMEGLAIHLEFADGKSEQWLCEQVNLRKLEGAEKWILQKSPESSETVLIEDWQLIQELQRKNPDWAKRNKQAKPGGGMRYFVWSFLGLLVLLVTLLVLGLPRLADYAAMKIPTAWEQDLGNQISAQVLRESKIDSVKTQLLRKMYGRMRIYSDTREQSGPIEIFVLKDAQFNAFAIPGRKIFVYSGAVDKVPTYPQLLALLGHETGHVVHRHSVRTLFRSAAVFSVFSFFLGDLSGLAGVLADNARSIQTLSYSRDFEREADREAFTFLCRNGLPVQGLAELMEVMASQTGESETAIPAFLQSHPLSSERLDNARAEIKTNPCNSGREDATLQSLFEELKK